MNIVKRQNENVQLKFDNQVLHAIATVDENDPDFLITGARRYLVDDERQVDADLNKSFVHCNNARI